MTENKTMAMKQLKSVDEISRYEIRHETNETGLIIVISRIGLCYTSRVSKIWPEANVQQMLYTSSRHGFLNAKYTIDDKSLTALYPHPLPGLLDHLI